MYLRIVVLVKSQRSKNSWYFSKVFIGYSFGKTWENMWVMGTRIWNLRELPNACINKECKLGQAKHIEKSKRNTTIFKPRKFQSRNVKSNTKMSNLFWEYKKFKKAKFGTAIYCVIIVALHSSLGVWFWRQKS